MIYCVGESNRINTRSALIFTHFLPMLSASTLKKIAKSGGNGGCAFFFTVENLGSIGQVLLHINFYFGEKDYEVDDLILEKKNLREWFEFDDPVLQLLPPEEGFFDEDKVNGKLSIELFSLDEEGKSLERMHKDNIDMHRRFYQAASVQNNGTVTFQDLSSYFSGLHSASEKIEFFSIGQANCSAWFSHNCSTPLAVFDLGFGGEDRSNPAAAISMLKSLDSHGAIIASHYDKDHINGFEYLSGKAWKRQWFLPMIRLSILTIMETKFLRKLWHEANHFQNCRFFHDNELTAPLYVDRLEISQGIVVGMKKNDVLQSNYENARSLICFLRGDRHSILIPGDALYGEFRKTYSPTYVIVPHHACRYDNPIKNLVFSDLQKAFVYCDPLGQAKYHHPNITHLIQYSSKKIRLFRFVLNGQTPLEFDAFGNQTTPLICRPIMRKKMAWFL